jgi:hypothetical protein
MSFNLCIILGKIQGKITSLNKINCELQAENVIKAIFEGTKSIAIVKDEKILDERKFYCLKLDQYPVVIGMGSR